MNDKDRHVDRSKDEASEAKAAPDSVQTKSGQEKDKETKMAAKAKFVPTPTYKYPIDTEWTREGFEEVLATVGVQCGYNTAVSLPFIAAPSNGRGPAVYIPSFESL